MSQSWQQTSLESLEVGASPLVGHFLSRLGLTDLLARHLPPLPGRQPALPSAVALTLLVHNLLLARQPLYALPAWAARRVPEYLGVTAEQLPALNDDRLGKALDHLDRADRASLLVALVRHAVSEFEIDLKEMHQDTTTVTFHGQYHGQDDGDQDERPPLITFGYNKDHRPDLKQLLLGITISADGAVPLHGKVYDGNTPDDHVHQETWDFLRELVGHPDFLYVADSKLCNRDNLDHIHRHKGKFLTVLPRTRKEDGWFRQHVVANAVEWVEVHRQADPRGRGRPEVVYHAVEAPGRSSEGYRVLWYRSSQKVEQDRQTRTRRLERAQQRLEQWRGSRAGRSVASIEEAHQAGLKIIEAEETGEVLRVEVTEAVSYEHKQVGPGRPGPSTEYRRIEKKSYTVRLVEDGEALTREALTDGLFPLMTNEASLGLQEALAKYKYQPFVEKRHEQLKGMFAVAPMWLKNVKRVSSLLWLYYVVELVGALVEREVRRRMASQKVESLPLYPEGRPSEAPTTYLAFTILEGHRRHRLLDQLGRELRTFHDSLPHPARQLLDLLGVCRAPYGDP